MSPLDLKSRARVAAFVGAAAVVSVLVGKTRPKALDRRAGVVEALSARGLSVPSVDDVLWVDAPPGVLRSAFGRSRAVVRAAPGTGEPADVFLVDTRLSPEGALLEVGAVFDLSDTTGAEEGDVVARGTHVAWVARGLFQGAGTTAVVVDLGGQPAPGADWTTLERAQNAVTNLQQTGQLRGVGKRTFAVEGSPKRVAVELDDEALTIVADEQRARVAHAGAAQTPPWLRTEGGETAKPGNLVTWSVDRVRAVPWIGDEAMQSLKALAFTALDFVLRRKEQMTGDTGAEGIAQDLGQSELEPAVRSVPVDPEIGWPPPPLETWVDPVLPGEGQWNSLDADPFVRKNEGLPGAFVTTFIRTDRTRKATRVYVALWDPRQVELHMMAGTVEPKSASGEAGPGLIPRTPEVLRRVVAASNAGFQAMHGEFGMMADGVVYLPPKPYAATVAALRDGSTGFGSWPQGEAIPENILSYRQNMTVMVQDEKFNPFGRTWWGGTVPGAEDKTHTVRTGICLTREKFVAYFYGADLSPDALAQAMIQARCSYGIALDMNAGHSGLEFYKVAPEAELAPLGRPVHTDWEAEGDVSGLEGWRFRGRRLIRGMGLMNFPRYIRREGRDFFYMTLRNVLPGPALPGAKEGAEPGKDGVWRVKGLPQHGFPYAIAQTDVALDGKTAHVLEVDPRTVTALAAATPGETVAVLDPGPAPAGEVASLWYTPGGFAIGVAPPVAGAVRLGVGAVAGAGSAAVGVRDEDGMLLYVELEAQGGADAGAPAAAPALEGWLAKAGCSTHLLLSRPLAIALGGDTSLTGQAVRAPATTTAIRLVRAKAPGAQRILEDTPVVPFNVWYPLQQRRVRYFKKPQTDDAK